MAGPAARVASQRIMHVLSVAANGPGHRGRAVPAAHERRRRDVRPPYCTWEPRLGEASCLRAPRMGHARVTSSSSRGALLFHPYMHCIVPKAFSLHRCCCAPRQDNWILFFRLFSSERLTQGFFFWQKSKLLGLKYSQSPCNLISYFLVHLTP